MNYVGIDYHKKYSVVTAIDEMGHVIQTTRLDNRAEPFQLVGWATHHSPTIFLNSVGQGETSLDFYLF